ncbi:hypothetical protein ACSBR1_023712 [Camellia fascicularis]
MNEHQGDVAYINSFVFHAMFGSWICRGIYRTKRKRNVRIFFFHFSLPFLFPSQIPPQIKDPKTQSQSFINEICKHWLEANIKDPNTASIFYKQNLKHYSLYDLCFPAYTKESAKALADTIQMTFPKAKLVLVVAMASDKDHLGFTRELLLGQKLLEEIQNMAKEFKNFVFQVYSFFNMCNHS